MIFLFLFFFRFLIDVLSGEKFIKELLFEILLYEFDEVICMCCRFIFLYIFIFFVCDVLLFVVCFWYFFKV